MHSRFRLISIVLLLALLSACAAQPQPTETPEATLDTTALAQSIADSIFGTLTAQPTNTPEPSATASPSPTVTASNTPTPETPIAVSDRDIVVRGGPGSGYPVVRTLAAADLPVAVYAISEDGGWAMISPLGQSGEWIGLSPRVTVHGDLSSVSVWGATPTVTLSPQAPASPEPTLDVAALAADIQAEVAESLLAQIPTAAPTLDVPVLVSTVQVAVVETLIANVTQQVADQATLQAAQQATQTARDSQPAEVDADDDPFWGPEDAAVTIIVFSDFSCTHCRNFAVQTLPRLKADYEDRVRFVFRDAPILGPTSAWAALAAECANDQGKFWDYHDLLFANQGSLARASLTTFAEQLDLNVEMFDTCVDNQTHIDELRNDLADAQNAGLTGTPTFFINGRRVEGAQPYEVFVAIIDEELEALGLPTGPMEIAVEATEEVATEAAEEAVEATEEAAATVAPTVTPRS